MFIISAKSAATATATATATDDIVHEITKSRTASAATSGWATATECVVRHR
jgi:hypothetical protein